MKEGVNVSTEIEIMIIEEVKRWNNAIRQKVDIEGLIQFCLARKISYAAADKAIRSLLEKEFISCGGSFEFDLHDPVLVTQKGYNEINGKNSGELGPRARKAATFMGIVAGEVTKSLSEQ